MESDALKSLELDKIGGLLGGSVASELHRMELERASWMAAMTQSHSLVEQMKKLMGDTSPPCANVKCDTYLEANRL